MKCAYCKKERETGSYYRFYYGKHIGTTVPAVKVRKYHYLIAGSIKAWICRACLIKRILTSITGVVAILLIVSVLSLFFKQTETGVTGVVVFGGYLLWFVSVHGVESIRRYGDEVAIRAYRRQLEAAGSNMFFTRAQHRELDKSA